MRLAAILLALLLAPGALAGDDDVDDGSDGSAGIAKRLRAIEAAAEREIDHPELAGEDAAAGEEQTDEPAVEPTGKEADVQMEGQDVMGGVDVDSEEPSPVKARRRTAPPTVPARETGAGTSVLSSPLRTTPDADDE